MLPVVAGEATAKRQSVWYAVLTVAASRIPFSTGVEGQVYLIGALLLGVDFIALAVLDLDGHRWTRLLFRYSIV